MLLLGVITVLPVFPYSRQPDVPYVRPDSPLANAPAMLFKDSVTVSSGPNVSPLVSHSSPDAKHVPIENITASAYLARLAAPGSLGLPASVSILIPPLIIGNGTTDQRWDEILEIGRQNRGNYRQWVAQAGTLVADLLTVAGADHIITMDLHVHFAHVRK